MSQELLDETTVVDYLNSRGLISGPAQVEELTGGVSCVVLAVSAGQTSLVLKQALPELKVASVWKADQRRAIVEANAMKLLHGLTPNSVPDLIDVDPDNFTLSMSRLPITCTNWKVDMLAGVIHPSIGSDLGEILATWHNYGAITQSVRDDFAQDSLFEQLRVTPFYRSVASKNEQLAPSINELIEEITTIKTTIVHGDFSPKNIMITQDIKPIVLDFEVAHTGNPVFDLAFVSAHLLCKFLRTTDQLVQGKIRQTALNFLDSYSKNSKLPVANSLPKHVALIARARVEGVSLVNYLDEAAKTRVLDLTAKALQNSQMTYAQLFL
jgi:5-methylthioribose kinase